MPVRTLLLAAVFTAVSLMCGPRSVFASRANPNNGRGSAAEIALVLSAPPRDTQADGKRRFGPVAAHNGEYNGLGRYLKDGWGFY